MSDLLREEALDAFLDQVIAVARGEDLARNTGDEEEDGAPELSPDEQAQAMARARGLLASRPLEPGDIPALERLFRIWMWLERPGEARAAVDAHEARLLRDLGHAERLGAAEICALWRMEAATRADGTPPEQLHALFEAAADGIAACSALPGREGLSQQRWFGLMQDAARARLPEVYERCAREVHAIQTLQPQRQHWRSFDDAALQLRLALAAELRGDADGAARLARKAAQTLSNPGPDQAVDEDDWLRLGPDMVRLAPDTLALARERAQLALGPHAGPARKRDLAVRLARLTAHSLWAQGDRDGALAAARQGRFLLTSDRDDGFTATVMGWLTEAGHEDQAAKMALEACWHSREGSGRHAIDLAKARLQAESDHAGLWTLALAAAAHEAALNEQDLRDLGHGTLADAQRHLLSHARALLPGHAAADVLQGLQLAAQGRHGDALPLLERLLDLPDMANQECATQLWHTRMRVLGAGPAVNGRFVETGAGNWSYALGVALSEPDEVMDGIELPQAERAGFPREAVVALSTRYYERALMQFEAFFATGEGNVRDGDIHTYSMNCNNLAIAYRNEDRHDEALALHHKGLATSPFAEHKSGVMDCLYALDRHAEFVEAAEQLWHFSLEHGYSRHDPCDYFGNVAWALQHLDRGHEIEIWLDRLREWRGMLDEDDLKENQPWLLGAEASMLDYLYRSKPEDTLARMQAIRPELMRIGRTWGLRRLGDGLLDAGQAQLALETYERAVAVFDPERDMEAARDNALKGVENARAAIRKQKPFWRRWL